MLQHVEAPGSHAPGTPMKPDCLAQKAHGERPSSPSAAGATQPGPAGAWELVLTAGNA